MLGQILGDLVQEAQLAHGRARGGERAALVELVGEGAPRAHALRSRDIAPARPASVRGVGAAAASATCLALLELVLEEIERQLRVGLGARTRCRADDSRYSARLSGSRSAR